MKKSSIVCCVVLIMLGAVSGFADTIDLGYASLDEGITVPGVLTLDIYNLTGSNSAAPDFPVINQVNFEISNVGVSFKDAADGFPDFISYTASYFTMQPDGSLLGPVMPTFLDFITSIDIQGVLSNTSLKLADGSTVQSDRGFSSVFTGTVGILSTTTSIASVPEPFVPILIFGGLCGLFLWRSRRGLIVLWGAILFGSCAFGGTVKLSTMTVPQSGVSGISRLSLTGSGFPVGELAAHTTVFVEKVCGITAGAYTTTATTYKTVLASVGNLSFVVPWNAPTGSYFVQVSGTDGGGFTASNCSGVQVTHPDYTNLGACTPGGAIGVESGNVSTGSKAVVAYVPNGSWRGSATGIRVVPVEGGGNASVAATPDVVNTCSSDSAIGETICTANNQYFYLLKGAAVTQTLSTGDTSSESYPSVIGGACGNCSVTVDSITNTAALWSGYTSPYGSNTGVSFFDLNTNQIGASTYYGDYTPNEVGEGIIWDPFRNYIISLQNGSDNLMAVVGTGASTGVDQYLSPPDFGYFGAGEDCTTGILLAAAQNQGDFVLYMGDLTQAVLTFEIPRLGSTWTTSQTEYALPELNGVSPVYSSFGVAVAPGTHLSLVAAANSGNLVGVIRLPATSGSGTPAPVDYVVVPMPKDPDGKAYKGGGDPPSSSAYLSPTSGRGFGIVADWASGLPRYLGVIDLAAALSAPRSAAHVVDGNYDLVGHGVVRYVAAF